MKVSPTTMTCPTRALTPKPVPRSDWCSGRSAWPLSNATRATPIFSSARCTTACLSGASLEGTHYFYANPLASKGEHHRQEWFGCACCPPNFARLLASLGNYLYAQSDSEAVVHLYAAGQARFVFDGRPVVLRISGDYPWDGAVRIEIDVEQPARFGLRLRIPEWCAEPSLRINGATVDLNGSVERGYARVERQWRSGDTVELDLPMTVRRLYAHPAIAADAGRVALQRGPLIYCLEGVDNGSALDTLGLPSDAELEARWQAELLGGVVTLSGTAARDEQEDWTGLYRAAPSRQVDTTIVAVPYYAWDNRDPGPMAVWIRESRVINPPCAAPTPTRGASPL